MCSRPFRPPRFSHLCRALPGGSIHSLLPLSLAAANAAPGLRDRSNWRLAVAHASRAVYRNAIVFSVLVDPHCNWTSQLRVTPSTERITCAGPSKSSALSSKRKSGPSCETSNFEPSRMTCIFTSAEWPV